jgi:hypothetical protein
MIGAMRSETRTHTLDPTAIAEVLRRTRAATPSISYMRSESGMPNITQRELMSGR